MKRNHQLLISWPSFEKGTTLGLDEYAIEDLKEVLKNAVGKPVYSYTSVENISENPYRYLIGNVVDVDVDQLLITVEYKVGKQVPQTKYIIPILIGGTLPDYTMQHILITSIEDLMGFMVFPEDLLVNVN